MEVEAVEFVRIFGLGKRTEINNGLKMKLEVYFNDSDRFCCDWLQNLMDVELITPGRIDDRSIHDVRPDDLAPYLRCHFFAGIGGWELALRMAGWPDDRPVWTGSCPCQPFSVAGKQLGFGDPRHLWPVWGRLIAKRQPATIFGEQVAGAPAWLRLVRGHLEAMEYAVGCMPIEAASADAEHFRDRYWFVADRCGFARQQIAGGASCNEATHGGARRHKCESDGDHGHPSDGQERGDRSLPNSSIDGGCQSEPLPIDTEGQASNLVDRAGHRHRALVNGESVGWGEGWTEHEFRSRGFAAAVADIDGRQYLECPDGKWRRLPPPRVRWLGTRIRARVAKLRAIGNAIDWRPAAQFVGAYLDDHP